MSARQLQNLLTSVIATLRIDTVTMSKTTNSKLKAECSNLRADIVTLTGNLKGDKQDLSRSEC
jgi:hypothetical protein